MDEAQQVIDLVSCGLFVGGEVSLSDQASADDAGEDDNLREVLDAHTARSLRTACTKLGLRPQSQATATKSAFVQMLIDYKHSADDGGLAGAIGPAKPVTDKTSTRRTKHCAFRLLNVLFSDEFADRLREIDATPSRGSLDRGAVNASSDFWLDVERAYASREPEYDILAVFRAEYDGVRPSEAIVHKAAKLCKLWKDLRLRYAAADTRFHKSGTHDSDFGDYCEGRLDILYLHDWLELKPNLLSRVDGRVPIRARMDTMSSCGETSSIAESETATPPPKKRLHRDDPAIDVLERLVAVMEAKASKKAVSSLDESARMARSTTQLVRMVEVAKAGHVSEEVVRSLQHEVEELVKETTRSLKRRREEEVDRSRHG